MKTKLAACCLIFLAGCKYADQRGSGADGKVEDEGKPAVLATPGWLELYDLSLHSDVEAVAPQGLYIRGDVGPGRDFVPTSGILGTAVGRPPETGVVRGWLELSGLEFHQMQEAVAPVKPYVEGVLDEDGADPLGDPRARHHLLHLIGELVKPLTSHRDAQALDRHDGSRALARSQSSSHSSAPISRGERPLAWTSDSAARKRCSKRAFAPRRAASGSMP